MEDERVEKLNQAARIERLNQAALGGDINDFYNLIKEDVKLLEHIDELPFVETPLHKVASATETHIPFAMEMLRLKPSFVRKLNPDGLSPIHVALLNGKTQVVRWLLKVDGDLVRVKGREGMTPLHDAAATEDHLDLLVEFLKICPDSIEDVTIRNETALHVAVKCKMLEAFKHLVEWLRQNNSKKTRLWKRKILNWKDEEGNTVLHVAVSTNQPKAVRMLLDSGVDINAKNVKDHTAGDILVKRQEVELLSSSREISEMLQRAEVNKCARYLRSIVLSLEERRLLQVDKWAKISDDRRNVVLVVATLLMTVTYQGLLSPPGGLWQDYYNPGSSRPNATKPDYRGLFNETSPYLANMAGAAIGGSNLCFWVFLITNTLTFMLSYTIVLLIIPSGYVILRAALGSLSLCYITSLSVIFPIYFTYTYSLILVILFSVIYALSISAIRSTLHVSVLIRSWKKNN
ncbi:ankyrin repeat-containing protein BDA1-like [Quercus lobata]|uniref:ankyrin repeat-containing protein BDA1-like n=1 Tax=Quercus lobata TaxID=97700 RepID=UPI00124936C3|nr:ankyrin repeat-containing protein BDA1-like [Quercus lobata]